MRALAFIAPVLLALGLAGCGDTTGERVITGATGGAVAGQVIADAPLAGAAVGGTIGALR